MKLQSRCACRHRCAASRSQMPLQPFTEQDRLPPEPTLLPVAVPSPSGSDAIAEIERPKVFNQLCIACHSLGGQGGAVGPALDGVGSRRDYDNLVAWLTDPQKLKPGTAMPKLPLSPSDIVELASFLFQMKQPPSKAKGQQG